MHEEGVQTAWFGDDRQYLDGLGSLVTVIEAA
jgi:hypothetical protein